MQRVASPGGQHVDEETILDGSSRHVGRQDDEAGAVDGEVAQHVGVLGDDDGAVDA